MITVSLYMKNGQMTGFGLCGHAGFAESGSDIVCAAVSVLVINTINAIEAFTEDTFRYSEDEGKGSIEFRLLSEISEGTRLLLQTLMLGLSGIQEEYGKKYIRFQTEEV
ncbi:MAG TPA: ribosomal-processing cysteine protease Prp [Candidatus Caccomorpha excrementavium]|nr:ribosomal-processing cysteine protease Prp [Candidatus Caccomorpha excrementavium]